MNITDFPDIPAGYTSATRLHRGGGYDRGSRAGSPHGVRQSAVRRSVRRARHSSRVLRRRLLMGRRSNHGLCQRRDRARGSRNVAWRRNFPSLTGRHGPASPITACALVKRRFGVRARDAFRFRSARHTIPLNCGTVVVASSSSHILLPEAPCSILPSIPRRAAIASSRHRRRTRMSGSTFPLDSGSRTMWKLPASRCCSTCRA
jgi:hypothetical protein